VILRPFTCSSAAPSLVDVAFPMAGENMDPNVDIGELPPEVVKLQYRERVGEIKACSGVDFVDPQRPNQHVEGTVEKKAEGKDKPFPTGPPKVESLSELLEALGLESADADVGGREGTTVLHYAAHLGLEQVCLKLLESENFTRVGAVTAGGTTALHVAARRGLEKVCRQILAKSDFDKRDAVTEDGSTALHAAARAGQTGVVQALLSLGMDPNVKDASGSTPLLQAIKHGGPEVSLAFLADPVEGQVAITHNSIVAADSFGKSALDYSATFPAVLLAVQGRVNAA